MTEFDRCDNSPLKNFRRIISLFLLKQKNRTEQPNYGYPMRPFALNYFMYCASSVSTF